MTIKIYGYKNCSTCKKAQGFLAKRSCKVEDVDITTTPPTQKELKGMLAKVGGQIKKLFNTSGQAYRELGLGDKLGTMKEGEALKLLAGNGRLVKRPFLVVDGEPVAVGFKEDEWREFV